MKHHTVLGTASNRTRNHEFYMSPKWKRKREIVMRHCHYEDQEARRYGLCVSATMVHHIYPLKDYPMLGLQEWNLLPLSATSHNKMHDRLTDVIVGPGLYWQRKRRAEFKKFFIEHGLPVPDEPSTLSPH